MHMIPKKIHNIFLKEIEGYGLIRIIDKLTIEIINEPNSFSDSLNKKREHTNKYIATSIDKGLCGSCGQSRNHSKQYCDYCALRDRITRLETTTKRILKLIKL